MVPAAAVFRAATGRFLPLVAAAPAALVVLSAPTAPYGLAGLRTVAWPALVGQPLVLTAGFLGALLAVRGRVAAPALASRRRAAAAALGAVGAWLAASVLVQPAGWPVIVAADLAAGAGAALLAFAAPGRGDRHRAPSA